MKLSVEEMREHIPEDAVRSKFVQREDISHLPPEEQEERWQEHLVSINKFREWLTQFDTHIVYTSDAV